MKQKELQKVLEKHRLWLDDCGGECANLSGANLSGADISGSNLIGVDLRGADLGDADLSGTTLSDADLSCANLSDATLSNADLRGADLSGATLGSADLRFANLRGADLSEAGLSGADLRNANLRYAHLTDAYLVGASLCGANLCGANLSGADLHDVKYSEHTAFFALQCPEEGAFVAWKKCRDDVLVKLLIPEDAKRSSATTRKCRASKAIVLEVIGAETAVSTYDKTFSYDVGKEVIPDSFDDNRWNECSNGISFFITRAEAENY